MSEFDLRDQTDDDSSAELAALRSFASRVGDEIELESPPIGLLDAITQAVRADDGDELAARRQMAASRPDAEHAGKARTGRSRWPLAVAAAVAALAVAASFALQTNRPEERLVASVDLERLAGNASGAAELVDVDGSMQLRISASGLDAAKVDENGDYLEVWVIDPSVSKLVSLGPLRSDGRYDVPDSVDMTQFPIVDVSVEPSDGNPTHSGNSVLRGTLEL